MFWKREYRNLLTGQWSHWESQRLSPVRKQDVCSPRPEVVAEQLTTMGMPKTLANQETGNVYLPRPEVVAEQLTTMGMPKMVGRYFSLDRK